MLDEGGTLRKVAWLEVCPWLNLFRCFRLAIQPRLLVLSAVAAMLTVIGWALLVTVLRAGPQATSPFTPPSASGWAEFGELVRAGTFDLVPDAPQLPTLDFASLADSARLDLAGDGPAPDFQRSRNPFWGTLVQLSGPLRGVFSSQITARELVLLLLCGLWALAVWAFFGAAVTRVAALELAREESLPWSAMLRHARSKWRSYFAAPLLLLVGVLVTAAGMGVVGMMLWSDTGLLIAGLLLWPLLLLGGLATAYLLLWLALGWPLMWPAISVEGQDSFEALSRSNQYLFQKPLHLLFYVFVAVVLGWLGWLVVSNFAAGVIAVTHWAADWGADTSRWPQWLGDPQRAGDRRIQDLLSGRSETGALGTLGAAMILVWCGCVKMLAVGFLYSFFWTASTCIYLLVRYDAEATELDEVFVEEENQTAQGLPPLGTDQAGAPYVADVAAPPSPEQATPAPEGPAASQTSQPHDIEGGTP